MAKQEEEEEEEKEEINAKRISKRKKEYSPKMETKRLKVGTWIISLYLLLQICWLIKICGLFMVRKETDPF